MIKSQSILYSGFFAILLLMVLFTSIAFGVLNQSVESLDQVINNNNAKTELLNRMRTAARERNICLQKMVVEDSEQTVEALWAEMGRYGGEFAEARQQLIEMGMTPRERVFLEKQAEQTRTIAPLQNRIAELAIFDEREQARKLLFQQAIPLQDKVFDVLSDLLTIQKQTAAMALEDARSEYNHAMVRMISVAVVIFIISINIIIYIIKRITRDESSLRFHRDNLEHLVAERTRELEDALRMAEQANTAKSEFVSTVSHELRTPLTSIRASLGLINGGAVGSFPENLQMMLDIAESNTERLIYLINDLLDVQKIEAGLMDFRFEDVDIQSLIQRALVDNRAYAAERNVTVDYTPLEGELMIHADPDRILQVLDNILSNAIKFSPENERVALGLEQGVEGIRLSVTDHGPGIPEEFRDKVFEKFTQADASDTRIHGGTGLGMNISKMIMQRHKGSIGFDTSKQGTTFWIQLPSDLI